jgi:hypothetical protein
MDWKMMPQGYPLWAVFRDGAADWGYGLVIGWFGDWPDSLRPVVCYEGEMIRPQGDILLELTHEEACRAVEELLSL